MIEIDFIHTFIYTLDQGSEMDIYYAISVSLILMNFAKAQPAPWICTFQNDECGIAQTSADDPHWFVVLTDDGNRYYRPAINQVGETYYGSGTFATFILPLASYPSPRRGVLSFRFHSYTANRFRQYGYLTVTTCEGRDPVLTLDNFVNYWSFKEIEFICGSNPVKISFTAVRGSSRTIIGVDTINVTEILTTTTEAVTSAPPQVTRGQTLTPSISPSLISSSISTNTGSMTRHDMSTGSILENTGTGNARSNHVVLPAVSSILIVLFIWLIVTSYVCWRKRPTAIEDKDSEYNGDKLYNNPVYSLHDNAHFQPDLLNGTPAGHLSKETQQTKGSIDIYKEVKGDINRDKDLPLHRRPSSATASESNVSNIPAYYSLEGSRIDDEIEKFEGDSHHDNAKDLRPSSATPEGKPVSHFNRTPQTKTAPLNDPLPRNLNNDDNNYQGRKNRRTTPNVLYAKPQRMQDSTERTGDNPTDIKGKIVPGHAVLYDDEEYNALDFNRDKCSKTAQNCTESQTYKPSLPGNSSETSMDDGFGYGVLEYPGGHGDDEYSAIAKALEDPQRSTGDTKAPCYENSEPEAPSTADQMEEGPVYYSYQDSLPVRDEDEYSNAQARSAAEAPRAVDFEPIYSEEVYGDVQ